MDGDHNQHTENQNTGPRWTNKPAQALPLIDVVLRLIWKEHQISRAEIARNLGLSRSTVTEIVKQLRRTPFVHEVGRGTSSGGRRPRMLEFVDEARCILGIDIGSYHVGVALTDLRCRLITWQKVDRPADATPDGTLAIVRQLCDACLASLGEQDIPLLSIGISLPLPVDPVRPERLSEIVIPDKHGGSGIEQLREHYGVPVYVDNDANLGALGEQWWGAARGVDDVLFIKLGTGIGAGYILNGELYRGAEGVAGEVGHLPIDAQGPPCVCGLNGCLVTYVGANALEARARTLLATHPESVLAEDAVTLNAIKKAALAGDEAALQVVHEAVDALGIALTGLINVLNPRMVVVGGGLAHVGDLFLEPLRDKVMQTTLVSLAPEITIQTSMLGDKVVALGASTLAVEGAFANPHFIEQTLLSAPS